MSLIKVTEMSLDDLKNNDGGSSYLFSSCRENPKSNVKKITSEIDELKYSVIDSNMNSVTKKKLLDKLYEMSNILNIKKGV